MSKIKTITVSNLKAVSNQTADFNGCTAIITAGNNKGKTSFLRTTIDRIRGIKPDQVLKIDEKQGFGEITMTDGCKFRWEFKEGGKEKLTYITEKDIKTSATREICDRYFPPTFDVDKFLNDQPKAQRKTLQLLAGLDFTDIDSRYKVAYDARTVANNRANDAKVLFDKTPMPPEVKEVDIAPLNEKKENIRRELNKLYTLNKNANTAKRSAWQLAIDKIKDEHRIACDNERQRVVSHNNQVDLDNQKISECSVALKILKSFGYSGDAEKFVLSLTVGSKIEYVEPNMPMLPAEPTYVEEMPDNKPLLDIDAEIDLAHQSNIDAGVYSQWKQLQSNLSEANSAAEEADAAVKAIEKERMDLIKSASMPEGFTFTDEGIEYNGLAFTREQLSSSGIYIAALKLASMKIGECRSLHFDASFLDRQSLTEIEKWAASQDLQLLIERPSFEGGEISYELIED